MLRAASRAAAAVRAHRGADRTRLFLRAAGTSAAGPEHPLHPLMRNVLHVAPAERVTSMEALEQSVEAALAAVASERGKDPLDLMNDLGAIRDALNRLVERAGAEGAEAVGITPGPPLQVEGVHESAHPGKEGSAGIPREAKPAAETEAAAAKEKEGGEAAGEAKPAEPGGTINL
jgi:hypothetical protein